MKKFLFLQISLFVFLIFGVFWWIQVNKPVSTDETYKSFVITKGDSAAQIGYKLFEENLIKSPLAFKFYVQLTGSAGKIQAGEYSLSSNLTLTQIIELLEKGPVEVWVTIPEGLTNKEIADKFDKAFNAKGGFADSFFSKSKGLEGHLFPDTYLFPKDASASSVIDRMVSTFDKKVGTDVGRQQIIMASILEKETKTDQERPVVAGILYKRLNAGWPLQVDAAVETYQTQGLPESPICNPGLSSIDASINPEDSAYWYYLHDSQGNIHYAQTLEEHNINIAKYLKN
ncbi:endolytic transglycosylase MltG [Patescibacteria group bacterium]